MSELYHLKFPFDLKKDQIDAVDSWIKNNRKGSIIYSTGTGKTEIAFECAKRAIVHKDRKAGFRVLFLVPRIVLIEQNIKRLIRYGIKKDAIGVYYGERKDVKDITFSTYQSIVKNFDLVRRSDMVILDEIHLISETAKKFSNIFNILNEDASNKAILGLTATIDESDPKYSKIMSLIPPVKRYMIKEAVNDGRLSKPKIILIPVKLNLEERGVYDKTSIAIKDISLKLRSSSPVEIARLLRYGGARARLAKLWFSNVQARKKLLSEASAKLNKTISIVKNHNNEKIMVFSETIESINRIQEQLKINGIPSYTIHNQIKTRDRKKILDLWGDSFFVLLSVHTLDIGFDIPSVSIAIIVSNTQNMNQLVQRIGRVLRKTSDKDHALIYLIYVEETKDKKILSLVRASLNSHSQNSQENSSQHKISAYFR